MDLRGGRDTAASSTALDTVLFVILVGAAVVILSGAAPSGDDPPRRVADETADVLSTSTTEVTYERWGDVSPDSDGGGVNVDRRASGTYAELLAVALLSDPALGNQSLTGGGNDLGEAVVNATQRAFPARDARIQVRAVWRPYPGSELGQSITMGESPSPNADVSVATVTVPSGLPNATSDYAENAASFDRIAAVMAERIIEGLFPPRQMNDAMASEGPDRAVAASRYRAASETLDVNVGKPLQSGNVEAANRLLTEKLEQRLVTDLTEEFDSPEVAARAVSVHRVRVVVRAWSP